MDLKINAALRASLILSLTVKAAFGSKHLTHSP